MIWSSFGRGLGRAGKNVSLVLSVYFINLIVALMLTIPVYKILVSTLGMSELADQFLGDFPTHWITTWFFYNSQAAQGYKFILLAAGVTYLLFQVFLSGGILEILTKPEEKFSLRRFFEGIGKHAWKFFFLFMLSGIIYVAVLWKGNTELESVFKKVYDRYPEEWMNLLVTWIRWGVILLILAGVNSFFDYTRIIYVLGRTGSIVVALGSSFWFMLRHIWKVFWVYILLALFAGIFSAAYCFGVSNIKPISFKEIGIIIGIQQVYILTRMWIRLSFYSGQTVLYEKLNPAGEAVVEASTGSNPEIDSE